MTDPLFSKDEMGATLEAAARRAWSFLVDLETRRVRSDEVEALT